jgi:hypothetical protein
VRRDQRIWQCLFAEAKKKLEKDRCREKTQSKRSSRSGTSHKHCCNNDVEKEGPSLRRHSPRCRRLKTPSSFHMRLAVVDCKRIIIVSSLIFIHGDLYRCMLRVSIRHTPCSCACFYTNMLQSMFQQGTILILSFMACSSRIPTWI